MALKHEELSRTVLQAAIEVHRQLGPGLLESAYEQCLAYELTLAKIPFKKEVGLPVDYKGMKIGCGYRIDFLIDALLVVELKSVDRLQKVHHAQLLTYMKLSKATVGLLINFNVEVLKQGIKRLAL